MKTPTRHHPSLRAAVDSPAANSTTGDNLSVARAVAEPDHELARSEAEALWAALGRARATGVPRVIASAEDAVFRFYLPLSHALAAGAAPGRSRDRSAGVHAAELGLASAVLSWHGSESGFLRFASGAITDRLHRSIDAVLPGRQRPRRPIAPGATGCPDTDDVVRRIH